MTTIYDTEFNTETIASPQYDHLARHLHGRRSLGIQPAG